MTDYKIVNTEEGDLAFSFWLFEEAIAYQTRKGYKVWNGYDKEILRSDVANRLHYKVTDGQHILCIFSVCYSDKIIWEERDRGDAVYLHRVVVNPNFKGHQQFGKILNWAIEHAKEKKIKYVRMDTWADNPNIIAYYKSFGFNFIGNMITPDSEELAIQQRNLALALLEYPVN